MKRVDISGGGGGTYLNSEINKCERTVSTGILDSCNDINVLK
jgi:hypothetical protein